MSRALRALAPLALSFASAGCVYVGWGRYPVPTNPGVEELGWSRWRVSTPGADATVELMHYNPRIGLVGLVVPVVPVPWFTDSDTLEVRIDGEAAAGSPFYDAQEIRLVYADPARAPLVGKLSGRVDELELDHAAREKVRLWFLFEAPPPREPFSLEMDGLPRFDLELRSRFTADVGQP